ncbi:MAG: zinc-ribbon and DUF3426 domain-containing protein [Acidiferrobacterales bacterium]
MNQKLQTQCPQCQTVFAITSAQLDAHQGVVRCGRCNAVFRADEHLHDIAPTTAPIDSERITKRPPPTTHEKPSVPVPTPATPEAEARPPAESPTPEEFVAPALIDVIIRRRRARTRAVFWGVGVLALVLILAAQLVFFYATELSRYPDLKRWVTVACERLGCKIRPYQDVTLIELLHTSVVRHPDRADALKIDASMVNRARVAQPYPLMELTLSDSTGAIVARRTFQPREYLKTSKTNTMMPPNLVIDAGLEVTSPKAKPGGYEIRLVAR